MKFQPTKKLTKGGVPRKRKMSSLATVNHYCVLNAKLDWKCNLKYSNWGCAYGNGFVVLAEGLHMFRLGAEIPKLS
jgi:hypothetical protein